MVSQVRIRIQFPLDEKITGSETVSAGTERVWESLPGIWGDQNNASEEASTKGMDEAMISSMPIRDPVSFGTGEFSIAQVEEVLEELNQKQRTRWGRY